MFLQERLVGVEANLPEATHQRPSDRDSKGVAAAPTGWPSATAHRQALKDLKPRQPNGDREPT